MTGRPILTLNKGTPQIVGNKSGDNYAFPNLITVDPVTADEIWENNGVLNINGGAPSVDQNYAGQRTNFNPVALPSASGTDSLAMGGGASATGNTSIATGRDSLSLSNQSSAFGGSSLARFRATALGNNASAEGQRSLGAGFLANAASNDGMAFGNESFAENIGEISYATGNFGDPGDVKYSTYICRGATNNANALIINPDGGTINRMILLPETFWGFEIDLIAFQKTTPFDARKVKLEGAIRRDASSNTTLVGTVTTTTTKETAGATTWSEAITANNTDNALQIGVTGESGHMINWVAVVRIVGTRDI